METDAPPRRLDPRKQFKHLYQPSAKEVSLVDVPELRFLLIDGEIEPGATPGTSTGFAEAVGALYSLAYTLKFMSKRRSVDPVDYSVMALEGLWTTPAGGADYATSDQWLWTLMIMQPEHITQDMFTRAWEDVRRKKDLPAIDRVRMEDMREGLCVQVMHVGPYADEPATIERMATFAQEHGYRFQGPHHEIYLGDPRTAKPENLKTVVRHQVVPSA